MNEISLLIFGKAVTLIAFAGVYFYLIERSAVSREQKGSEYATREAERIQVVRDVV